MTTAIKVARQETFGPLAPLFRLSSDENVIEMANDTEFGLVAYYYSCDIGQVWRVSEALAYGIVGINIGLISNEVAPLGGMKQSGIGREGSHYGIDDRFTVAALAIWAPYRRSCGARFEMEPTAQAWVNCHSRKMLRTSTSPVAAMATAVVDRRLR